MRLRVFPDYNEAWYFDEKISETYVLQSIDASIPKSCIFHTYDDVKEWLMQDIDFPIVAKLRSGSGSHNVKLLKSNNDVLFYAKRMFKNGYNPSPSIFYKAKSNYASSKKNKNLFLARITRIPEFYQTWKNARQFPNEKGYCFFQEFIPNDGYDLKIVIVGNKLGFIGRNIRKNDFRASGGGNCFFDKSLITKNIINSSFFVSDKLNYQCMGYDYVVDRESKQGKIVEMSYGFSHATLLQSNGYFDRDGVWYNEPLNAPEEILKNIINDNNMLQ